MLSYRHGFHAGNFADVLKHAVLSLVIEYMIQKDKPVFYLETHAGAGGYPLDSEFVQKNREYLNGIGKLWHRPASHPQIEPYLKAVQAFNFGENLSYYPGSPRIARYCLREHDRMVLWEKHPTELQVLKQEFLNSASVSVSGGDGYEAFKACLPPRERRGLILIDPSYEGSRDYAEVISRMHAGYRRFPTGTYMLWYPVVQRTLVEGLLEACCDAAIPKMLYTELCVAPDHASGKMTGSGLILINPPWCLQNQLKELLPWLTNQLAPADGFFKLQWLNPE
ncbi:MAG: 23S rRNA (adenine(2030)-N(6))-methyltransferase RlmJ [SAR324 cluster bacterium]|nr:23S rRNA (adenine(2030)-N(6))-methyltransferase RlmJ [SAR324 cluster bacterium]